MSTDVKPLITERRIGIDTRTGRLGYVMGEQFGEIYLRPLLGGAEWTLPTNRFRLATAEETAAALLPAAAIR